MPIIDHAALLDVDADRAWAVLRRFGAIAEWHPAISSSKIENGVADGAPGAIRCLTLADGSMLRECLLALDDANRSFTYRFEEAALPVDDYHKRRAEGKVDAVAFGRLFIGNPDLVKRLRIGADLTEAPRSVFYGGGAKGYTDWPTLDC